MDPFPYSSTENGSWASPLSSNGFESYLASGLGLLPGLQPLALGAPVAPGLISEQQLSDWMTWNPATEGLGVSITGLEGGGIHCWPSAA
jgi:hypothetical protein